MKKFTALFVCIILALSMTACGEQIINPKFDEKKPWSTASNYEKSVYTVEKWSRKRDGKTTVNDKLVATGTLTAEVFDNFRKDEDGISYSKLVQTFTITYDNENAEEHDRGITDTITSEVEFGMNSLAAYKSKRVQNAPARKDGPNMGYTVEADYLARSATKTQYNDKDEAVTNTLTIPEDVNATRDNEQSYYLTRALALAPKAQFQLNMYTLYDCFNMPKVAPHIMSITCAEGLETVILDGWVEQFGIAKGTDGKCGVESIVTQFGLVADKKSGPPITLYYSNKPFVKEGVTTNKVLVKQVYKEYDIPNAAEKYNLVLTLSDYTTENTADNA